MNDYPEWLTAGLILLWILAAHDARAAPKDAGSMPSASLMQNAVLAASPFPVLRARAQPRPPAAGAMIRRL